VISWWCRMSLTKHFFKRFFGTVINWMKFPSRCWENRVIVVIINLEGQWKFFAVLLMFMFFQTKSKGCIAVCILIFSFIFLWIKFWFPNFMLTLDTMLTKIMILITKVVLWYSCQFYLVAHFCRAHTLMKYFKVFLMILGNMISYSKVSWSYPLYSTILMVHDPFKENHLLWKGQIIGYYFGEPMRS